MIKPWRHKGLEQFFVSESKASIRADHASRLKRQLARLDEARSPQDMHVPGWKLHPLHDNLEGHFSVWVNGNWRVTFTFEGTDAILVDYQDDH